MSIHLIYAHVCAFYWVQSRYRAKKSTNKRKKNKDTQKSIRCRQYRLPSCLVFLLFCSKTSRTWTRCSFAKASGGQKTELISHLKSICIDTFWQHTGCFKNYFVECWKPRLGYRHTDDYVWPFNCLEFFWVHKYPFKRCGWFFGIWKAGLIFAFLDAREQGKRLKLSQWQVRKIHDTVKRMLSYAGPVWKRLHLTIWTPSWELKQTEHFLDAC